ncbi:MAG: hypothetical protein UH963_05295 [Agathobacter sp.]|nr:hypothetical protein [Agathobacter sp.]
MKKLLIKPIVLISVFIVSLITFSMITNRENEDLTTVMADATLPVMYFYNGDVQINELHGYVNKMDAVGMRDSITPVNSDRILSVCVDTYGSEIDGISYEVRSLDSKRLVAESEIKDFKIKNNKIESKIKMQNILEKENEYLLVFELNLGSESVYYYTRIMQTDDCNVNECLDFALDFHEKTFSEEGSTFFPTYMEETIGDTTTLNHVDLSCTVEQIMWGDFKGEPLGKPVASYKEINESYNVITLSYILQSKNEHGETEYYNVEEYYRLRQSDTRMYVLNFERDMNQIFRGENNFVTEDSNILLGIRDKNVNYKVSGDIIAFVQEGELWTFNQETGEITRVFSFRDGNSIDVRNNWNQHEIKIIGIDEAGSVDFIVYGYMNRGDHEGEVGTAVYRYDGLSHTVEEQAFIPFLKSYEILKAEMGQLMYLNESKIFYIMIDGKVCSIDLNTLEYKVVIDNLKTGCYAASLSNQYFAWVDSKNEDSSTTLQIMNLKTGVVSEVTEGDKKYLKPLGFIDEDFVYGIAKESDIVTDAAGNTTFAMKCLKIMDTSENKDIILKEYVPKKGYIESINIVDYTINVNLIKKSNQQFFANGQDTIMNKNADSEDNVVINSVTSDKKKLEYEIGLSDEVVIKKTNLITSKSVILDADRNVDISDENGGERFYVYVKGKVLLDTDSISDAINLANQQMGVVVDSKQQYVWMRARKTYCNAFTGIEPARADESGTSIVKCISAMLSYNDLDIGVSEIVKNGTTPKEILVTALKDEMVLDVTGCKAEDIIFYVSEGSPVFAMTGSDDAVLVIGYSSTNIFYYDPVMNKTKSVTYEQADEMFVEGGNRFFTYLNN